MPERGWHFSATFNGYNNYSLLHFTVTGDRDLRGESQNQLTVSTFVEPLKYGSQIPKAMAFINDIAVQNYIKPTVFYITFQTNKSEKVPTPKRELKFWYISQSACEFQPKPYAQWEHKQCKIPLQKL